MIQTLKTVKEYKESLIAPARLKARHESSHQAKPCYGEKAGRAGDDPPAGGEGRGGVAPGAGH